MCRTAILGLILLLALMATTTQTVTAGGIKISGPQLEVSPLVHDFGELPQETIRRINVVLRNVGTEDLEINNVESDCGCTVAMLPDTLLAPGDSTYLHVTFSTKHYSNAIAKHVTIQSNDPGAPQTMLTLRAYVRTIVSVVPNTLDYKSVTHGDQPTLSTRLAALQSDTLKILDVVYPTEAFELEQTSSVDGDSLRFHFDFTLKPDAPLGAMNSQASIHTNLEAVKQIPIRLRGLIHGFFATEPHRLSLGQLREGIGRMRKIALKASRPGKQYVTSVAITNNALIVELITIEEGRSYEVSVTAPPSLSAGRYRCRVKINTDDPAQPEISVPVSVKVQKAR